MTNKVYILIVFLISGLFFWGCKKDSVNSNTIYKGKVIIKDCPSLAVIEVTNASIGETWTLNETKYSHVIAVSNFPDNIEVNSSVSFQIDPSGNWQECMKQQPCPTILTFEWPSDIFCSKDLKSTD